jgi:hypothetical protein
MKTKFKLTPRGFGTLEFKDRYGEECSLQQSSLASENAIWFGVDEAKPIYEDTAKPFILPDNVVVSGRMHLTQDQVIVLLPYLQHFVKTGWLPSPEDLMQPLAKGNNVIKVRIKEDLK